MKLADDVTWLLGSLGFRVKRSSRVSSYRNGDGDKVLGQRAYTLFIQGPQTSMLFGLERKRARCNVQFNGGVSEFSRRVVSIEPEGRAKCRCITVDHPNGLYLTNDFIVTHNSTLLGKLIREERRSMNIACCAYTGKAANVLAQKLGDVVRQPGDREDEGVEVTTIHRLIYNPYENEDGDIRFKRRGAIRKFDLFVIDEASMVSDRMLEDLKGYNVPILAMGDHGQLPPVGDSGTLMANPNLRLEKIHRQAESSPIIQVAHAIRQYGKFPLPLPAGVLHLLEQPFRKHLDEHARLSDEDRIFDTAVLCYTNRARKTFNRIVRTARWGEAAASEGPVTGDVVICLRNNHNWGIFNGMRGVIEAIKHKDGPYDWMKIRFPDDRNRKWSGNVLKKQFGRERTYSNMDELRRDHPGEESFDKGVQLNDVTCGFFDYGYSLTVHKSQGSQFHTVYLVLEFFPRDEEERWLWRRWAYTAATRAVDTLIVVERR